MSGRARAAPRSTATGRARATSVSGFLCDKLARHLRCARAPPQVRRPQSPLQGLPQSCRATEPDFGPGTRGLTGRQGFCRKALPHAAVVNLQLDARKVLAKGLKPLYHRVLARVAGAVMQIRFGFGLVGGTRRFEPGEKRRDTNTAGNPDLVGLAISSVEIEATVGSLSPLHPLGPHPVPYQVPRYVWMNIEQTGH